MSGMYDVSIYFDEVGENSLQRVQKLLSHIPGATYKAVGSALARSAATAKSKAAKMVTSEYAISQSTFRSNTKNINHFIKSSYGISGVEIGFRGYMIPLIKFDTTFTRNGRIHTRVKRNSVRKTLDHVFAAQVGGHTGVFERLGPERFPIEEKYGPSTAHMFMNENVTDKMDETIRETYEKRIEHEISRILNGYGV